MVITPNKYSEQREPASQPHIKTHKHPQKLPLIKHPHQPHINLKKPFDPGKINQPYNSH